MKINADFEQEVNTIRLNLYEKTKDMTPTELNEYYRQSTEDTIKEYGFKVVIHVKMDAS